MGIIESPLKVGLAIDIIPEKGGQCSFYLKLPKNKGLETKIG
jgi:hypothetical protein